MKSILVRAVLLSLVSVIYCSSEPCSKPTDAEMNCFLEKGTKSSTVGTQCKGVDFDILKQGNVQGSHVCQFPECIAALGKDIYAPCNRSDLTACVHKACSMATNCSEVTMAELQCMADAGAKNGEDLEKYCSSVDFDLMKEKKIVASKVCAFPDCITALEKYLYTPCNRSDLGPCVSKICDNPCGNIAPEEDQCMKDAYAKESSDLSAHCKGVDFDLLEKKEVKESKVCEHKDCITAITKDLYAPCNRSDLTVCIRLACNCSAVTPDEVKCLTDAGTKNAAEVEMHCQGVDLEMLAQGNYVGSKICDHPDCITALGKYVYTPCKRSDLISCVRSGCPMRKKLFY